MGFARADTVFTARIAKVRTDRAVWWIFVGFLVALAGPTGDEVPEPRYRVLVQRFGQEDEVGVAEARTRRSASKLLAAVQQDLAQLSETEFRDRYDLVEDRGPS